MGGKGSLVLFRVRGLPVRLHYTFLIIMPYLAWAIGQTTPALARLAGVELDALVLPRYLMGALLALGLFTCVLLHEFAHVAVGIRGGGRFSGVTLMIVGGVSEVIELPKRPVWEAAMAVAGPLASLGLAALGFAAFELFELPADVRFAVFYLAYVNFALALFNLVPAFPMDGGRILRAVLAMMTSRLRATQIASYTGQLVAGLFLLGGLYTANWVLLFIGGLVIFGARAELNLVRVGAVFEGLTVRSAMQPGVPTVEESEYVSALLERMGRELRTTYFVVSEGAIVGAITAAEARRREEAGEGTATVGQGSRRCVPLLGPDDELAEAARTLRGSGLSALPVVRDGELLGLLTLGGLAAAVRERDSRKVALLRERRAT